MNLTAEAAQSIYAAYRLARLDAGAVALFNTSVAGAWRSFFAAVLIAPLFFALVAMGPQISEGVSEPGRYWAAEIIAYVISWTAYPVVMAMVTESLDRGDRFVPYLVVYNWAAVIQAAVFIPVNMLQLADVLPADVGNLLWLAAFGALCGYLWFIARTVLAITALSAMAIVALDIMLGIAISIVAQGFY